MTDNKYVLSFDLGRSSGVALGKYSETEPYSLVQAWQFGNGCEGLIDWLHHKHVKQPYTAICEKYVPLSGKGFNQTLASVEALVAEGVLLAFGVMPFYPDPRWRRPVEMYFVGGKDKAEKRKRLKKFLKDTDNYVFGKELGQPDNEDSVSAIAHGIAYVMKIETHAPTFRMVADWKGPK